MYFLKTLLICPGIFLALNLLAQRLKWNVDANVNALFDTDGKQLSAYIYDDVWTQDGAPWAIGRNVMDSAYYLLDTLGNTFGPFAHLHPTNNGLFKACRDNQMTLVDARGQRATGWQWFESFSYFHNGYAVVWQNGLRGFINTHGKIIIPPEYESVIWLTTNRLRFQKHGKYGLIDRENRPVVPAIYHALDRDSTGLYKTYIRDQGYGLIDSGGKQVLPCTFRVLQQCKNKDYLAQREEDKQFGILDYKGDVILPFKYEFLGQCRDSIFIFKQSGKWGLVSRTGRQVAPAEYSFANALYSAPSDVLLFELKTKNNRYRVVDAYGETLLERPYQRVGWWGDDLIISTDYDEGDKLRITPKSRLWKISSRKFITPEFREIYPREWGFFMMDEQDSTYYLDKNGAIIKPDHLYRLNFQHGLALRQEGDKYGYIDTSGVFVIAPQFDVAYNFHNGYAQVEFQGQFGAIDLKGRFIPYPFCDEISHYFDTVAFFQVGDKYGLLHRSGKTLLQPFCQSFKIFWNGTAKYRMNGFWGLVRLDGTLLTEPVFDDIYGFLGRNNITAVQIGTKFGYMDKNGKLIISVRYDNLVDRCPVNSDALLVDKNGYSFKINRREQEIIIE